MLATAILITKEKEYPKEILSKLPKFDEVIIETECPSILRRYELAQKARNTIIYVQDDDCIIDVDRLYNYYNGRITNAISQHHKDWYKGAGITLIGYGAFFPKQMVNFDKYLDVYGVTPLFLTQADRVFTYLNQPFNSVVMDITHLPTATAEGRMSTSNGHWENLELIKKQLYGIPNTTHNR